MKKVLALLTVALLVGCGSQPGGSGIPSSSTPTSDASEMTQDTSNTAPSSAETVGTFNTNGTIEEQTIYDQDGVLIKASSLTYESSRAKLLINIENNGTRDLSVLSGTMGLSCNAVNGWMIHDGWINVDIPAGKKANDNAYFDFEPMLACGITGIETLYVTLQLEFDNNYSNTIITDPIEIKTSLSSNTDQDLSFDKVATRLMNIYTSRTLQFYDDSELFDSSGIKVTGAAYLTSSDGEKILLLELNNNSDQVLDVDSSNISANGFSLCSSRWSSETLIPGKKGYMCLELDNMKDEDDWKAMGITDISDISLDLGVRNMNYDYLSQPKTISLHVADSVASADTSGEELYSANGIRIISKGLQKDNSSVKWKLLIQNDNDFEIEVSDGWGKKLSIDDYMIDYLMWSEYIGAHQSSIAEIEINNSKLQDAGIDPNNIGVAEMELEIKDENYHDIDNPKIVVDFSATAN